MMETVGNKGCPADTSEFARWFARAHDPWNPITAAKRQLDALSGDTETAPALAAYDHLYEMADQAVRWPAARPAPGYSIRSTCRGTSRCVEKME